MASIKLNESDPQLGAVVTFTVTHAKKVKNPRIEVLAFQGGTEVYRGDAEAAQQFLLGGAGSDWSRDGGPADCTATLYERVFKPTGTRTDYATVAFTASG